VLWQSIVTKVIGGGVEFCGCSALPREPELRGRMAQKRSIGHLQV
jgi:hypothetical protein